MRGQPGPPAPREHCRGNERYVLSGYPCREDRYNGSVPEQQHPDDDANTAAECVAVCDKAVPGNGAHGEEDSADGVPSNLHQQGNSNEHHNRARFPMEEGGYGQARRQCGSANAKRKNDLVAEHLGRGAAAVRNEIAAGSRKARTVTVPTEPLITMTAEV